MALRTLTKFRNPDITSDLNNRIRDLILPGVFFGGTVTPVIGTLQVDVQPFGAMGADGMVTLLEGAPERVSVQAGTTNLVLLHAKYVANDAPIAEIESLTQSQFDALSTANQSEYIQFAKVTLAVAATEVTSSDIDTRDADFVDQQGRSPFRGIADTLVDLPDHTDPPTGITTQNRPDDLWFVSDDRVFYSWNTSGTPQWSAVISSAAETELLNHKQNQDDGTDPPDFIEAQHVLLKHRASLDEGSAGTKLFGASGTAFGAGNAVVDEKFPHTILKKEDFTLPPFTKVKLTGRVYVGTGAVGTASQYIRLAFVGVDKMLLGTDNQIIFVDKVLDPATGTVQIDPSTDADALGFIENPWVNFNFGLTIDTNLSSASVWYHTYVGIGEATVDEKVSGHAFTFITPAVYTPLHNNGFQKISASTVQDGFASVDGLLDQLALYGKNVLTVGPTGSGALFTGNDQTPFASAMAEASSQISGGAGSVTIAVLPGTYTITTRIAVSAPGVIITGVTDPKSGSDAAYFTGDVGSFFVLVDNVNIRNIHFDDRRTAGSAASIDVIGDHFNCSGCYFQRDTAVAVGSSIITNNGNLNLSIHDNKFKLGANIALVPALALGATASVDFYNNLITDEGATVTEQSSFIDIDSTGWLHASNIKIRNNIYKTESGSIVRSFVYVSGISGLDTVASDYALSVLSFHDNVVNGGSPNSACIFVESNLEGVFNLSIESNNVEWGTSGTGPSFLASDAGGTEVRNLLIQGNTLSIGGRFGSDIVAAESVTIVNNTIYSTEHTASSFYDAASGTRLVLKTNRWTFGGVNASTQSFSDDAHLIDNEFIIESTNVSSMSFSIGSDSVFKNNTIRIPSATVTDTNGGIVQVQNASTNVDIIGNKIFGRSALVSGTHVAIYVQNSEHCRVKDNVLESFGLGAEFTAGSSDCEFSGNNTITCSALVYFDGVNGQISNNVFIGASTTHFGGNYLGVISATGSRNTLSDNKIRYTIPPVHSRVAASIDPVIYIEGSDGVVEGNVIRECHNANVGIQVAGNQNKVEVRNNSITTLGKAANWINDPDFVVGIYYGDSSNPVTGGHIAGNIIRDIHRSGGSTTGDTIGIYYSGKDCFVTDNDIEGDSVDYSSLDYGLLSLSPSSDDRATVHRNMFRYMIQPISLLVGEAHDISNNTFFAFRIGLATSSRARISNNYFDFQNIVWDESTNEAFIGIGCNGGQNSIIGNVFLNTAGATTAPTLTGHRCVIGCTGSGNVIKSNTINNMRYATCGIKTSGFSVVEGNNIYYLGTLRGGLATPDRIYGVWLRSTGNPSIGASVISNNNIQKLGNVITAVGIINNGYDHTIFSGNNIGASAEGGTWDKAIVNDTNADGCTFVSNDLNGRGVTDNGTNTFGAPLSGSPTTTNMNNL